MQSLVVAVLGASVVACHNSSVEPTEPPPGRETAIRDTAGRYVVVLRDDLPDGADQSRILASAYSAADSHTFSALFHGFATRLSAPAVTALRERPEVMRLVPEQAVTADALTEEETARLGREVTTDFDAGWALGRIDQRHGVSDFRYTYATTGRGVNLYIIGNGVDASHPDFGGRVVPGWTYDRKRPPTSGICHHHETAIASIAAGARYGVARDATIHSVRANDCDLKAGHGDILAAIEWVTANHVKPAVLNLSWSVPAVLDGILPGSLYHAALAAKRAGIFVVVSASNQNANACSDDLFGWNWARSPANALQLMTVAATDFDDRRSVFSNYGHCVDLFAPGQGVRAAGSRGGHAYYSGTSYAAPFVAGVAALLYEAYPDDTPDEIHYAIRNGATANVVRNPGPSTPNLLLYSRLPAAVRVSIRGPTRVGPKMQCQWTAETLGGRGPFRFEWDGALLGDQRTAIGTIVESGYVNVTVTDALEGRAETSHWVTVDPSNGQVYCR